MSIQLFKASRFDSPYDVLGYQIRLMSAFWHRRLNAELAPLGLTEMQFVLLIGLGWLLEKQSGGITQSQLADGCSCSKALTSQVLQTLKHKGLVDVASDKADARTRLVKLSPAGENILGRAVVVLDETDEKFWEGAGEIKVQLSIALQAALKFKVEDGGLNVGGRMPGLVDGD